VKEIVEEIRKLIPKYKIFSKKEISSLRKDLIEVCFLNILIDLLTSRKKKKIKENENRNLNQVFPRNHHERR
jgi:hypothetical protein